MDLRKLADYLEGRLGAEPFRAIVRPEAEEFSRKMRGGEKSIPLYGGHDEFRFVVQPAHVRLICEGFLAGTFTGWDVYYLSELLMFGRSFVSESCYVEEAIFRMSDPVTHRPLSSEAARVVAQWLDEPHVAALSQMLRSYAARA